MMKKAFVLFYGRFVVKSVCLQIKLIIFVIEIKYNLYSILACCFMKCVFVLVNNFACKAVRQWSPPF